MIRTTARNLTVDPDFIEDGKPECAFRNLWAAVIAQAVRDVSLPAYHAKILRWLGSASFRMNCEILEMEPTLVARKFRLIIADKLRQTECSAPTREKRMPPRREGLPRAVDQLAEMQRLRDQGLTVRAIGEKLQLSSTMVSRVLTQGNR